MMNRKRETICLLALAAALSVAGCGTSQQSIVTIDDPATAESIQKNVKIVSPMGRHNYVDIWGNPPRNGRRNVGMQKISPSAKFMGLSGIWITATADENGFTLTDEGGNTLCRESYNGSGNFRIYRLPTTDGDTCVWVVEGPNMSPAALWVIGETKEGFLVYATPEEFAKEGLTVEQPGRERLAVSVRGGGLLVEKSHIDKTEPGKVTWKVDKTGGMVWNNDKKAFVMGEPPKEDPVVYGSADKISENKIESIGKRMDGKGARDKEGLEEYVLTTSNGKNLSLVTKPGYFTISSEDGSVSYYTSEIFSFTGGRFDVQEIETSNPDTRLWSVIYDGGGNSGTQWGYWLIGEEKGHLRIYLTPADMEAAGMPLPYRMVHTRNMNGHKFYFKANDGVLEGAYVFEYTPEGKAMSSSKEVREKSFLIRWDEKKQSFILDKVEDSDPVYLPRFTSPEKQDWIPMTDQEVKEMEKHYKW